MSWKILLTDGLATISDEVLLSQVELDDKKGISAEDLMGVIADYDAVIVRGRTKITEEVLSAAKKLKVVGRMGVGVDNIDLKAAKAHGVTVVNAPVATTVSVAELTIGLMLSLIRCIPKANEGMKAGQWLKKELKGTELYQKTLGVIGFGHIGEEVGKRAMAFGMKIIAYDPVRPPAEIEAAGADPVSFDELLEKADIITMHIPHIEATHYLLNEKAFKAMKSGVRIICAARGGVIDQSALLAALENGKVAGAALDVFEKEPPGEDPLVMHPNVICTPHIGAQTDEAQLRAGHDILSEVVAALEEEPLRWKVA
ncbi:MAG: D-3-phosphoglycerate dehydrogenase [Anaerolineaceae bacterium 46_22]|nr:MAG: D-3-phosphoglycerate dehydrogenase [Anaerolineaceae bacterium 46_22]